RTGEDPPYGILGGEGETRSSIEPAGRPFPTRQSIFSRGGRPRRRGSRTMPRRWEMTAEFRAGWPQGIAPLGLPQIRTCTFAHTAPHIMSSLRDGSLSESALRLVPDAAT